MKQNATNAMIANGRWPLKLRLALATALLAGSGFCAFGFLCTFEPNPWWIAWPWRIGYGGLGLSALVATVKLLRKPGRQLQ